MQYTSAAAVLLMMAPSTALSILPQPSSLPLPCAFDIPKPSLLPPLPDCGNTHRLSSCFDATLKLDSFRPASLPTPSSTFASPSPSSPTGFTFRSVSPPLFGDRTCLPQRPATTSSVTIPLPPVRPMSGDQLRPDRGRPSPAQSAPSVSIRDLLATLIRPGPSRPVSPSTRRTTISRFVRALGPVHRQAATEYLLRRPGANMDDVAAYLLRLADASDVAAAIARDGRAAAVPGRVRAESMARVPALSPCSPPSPRSAPQMRTPPRVDGPLLVTDGEDGADALQQDTYFNFAPSRPDLGTLLSNGDAAATAPAEGEARPVNVGLGLLVRPQPHEQDRRNTTRR
ncbi:hypothetical protein Q5752_002968 [Cryptotrichosporon argae]